MVEDWKKSLDEGRLTDCINHELLIAKLIVYGFDSHFSNLIFSYLTERKQRAKYRIITILIACGVSQE